MLCAFLYFDYAVAGIKDVDKSVVIIFVGDGSHITGFGTGFVIAPEIVITNYHVAGKGISMVVVPNKNASQAHSFRTEKIWGSEADDIQLLKVASLNLAPISLSSNQINKGQKVYAIGFPGVADANVKFDGIESTVTEGIVGRNILASWTQDGSKQSLIQHSASINQGNSGGPLIDDCGRVVGINTAKAITTLNGSPYISQTEGIFFATSISNFTNIFQQIGIPIHNDTTQCGAAVVESNEGISNIKIFYICLTVVGLIAFSALFLALNRKINFESYTQFLKKEKNRDLINRNFFPSIEERVINQNRVKYRLKILSGFEKPILLDFPVKILENSIFIGRDATLSDLIIPNAEVSRRHGKFKLINNKLYYKDLESKNKSYINDQLVGRDYALIVIGDKLRLGSTTVLLETS